jgi:hypothetical protein
MATNPYWNVYVPGPTSGTDWNQGYIRVGATDPTIENTTTLQNSPESDFAAGMLLYTTGKLQMTSQTSTVKNFGTGITATVQGVILQGATYSFSSVASLGLPAQIVLNNGVRFTMATGSQSNVILGNKMDWNLGNHARIFSPLKFEEILGLSVKYAPIEVGLNTGGIELKGGAYPAVIKAVADNRGVKGALIGTNPLTDGAIGGLIATYNTSWTVVNTLAIGATSALGALVGAAGFFAYGTSEEALTTEMIILEASYSAISTLFAVTEVIAIYLARLALTKRAADPLADYANPVSSTVKCTPAGILLATGTTWMLMNATGISMSGPSVVTNGPMQSHTPVPLPPVPVLL